MIISLLVVLTIVATLMALVRRYVGARVRDGRMSVTKAAVLLALPWAFFPILAFLPILTEVTEGVHFGLLFASLWAVVNFVVAWISARVLFSIFMPILAARSGEEGPMLEARPPVKNQARPAGFFVIALSLVPLLLGIIVFILGVPVVFGAPLVFLVVLGLLTVAGVVAGLRLLRSGSHKP